MSAVLLYCMLALLLFSYTLGWCISKSAAALDLTIYQTLHFYYACSWQGQRLEPNAMRACAGQKLNITSCPLHRILRHAKTIWLVNGGDGPFNFFMQSYPQIRVRACPAIPPQHLEDPFTEPSAVANILLISQASLRCCRAVDKVR